MTVGQRRALLVVLLLALALRLLRLGWHDAWADEGFSIWLARLSGPDFLSVLRRDAHPPLFYLLLKGWLALLPRPVGDFAARLPFALVGVGTVAAAWWLGRALVGEGAALLGAFLVAVSQSAVMLDQETRMYALLALLATVSTGFLARLLQTDRPARPAVGYGVTLLLALYTHYLALFLLLGHAAAVGKIGDAFQLPRESSDGSRKLRAGIGRCPQFFRPALRAWALAAGAALAAFLPWAATVGMAQIRAGAGPPHAAPAPAELPAALYTLASGMSGTFAPTMPAAWVVMAALAATAVLGGRPARALLGSVVVVPLAAVWLGSRVGPVHFFSPKYFTFVLPPLWLWVAAAARTAGRAGRTAAVVGVAVLLAANVNALRNWDSGARFQKSRWKDAVALVRREWRPGDAMLVMNGFQIYVAERYLRRDFGADAPVPLTVSAADVRSGRLPADVAAALRRCRRLWLLLCNAGQVDPEKRIPRLLAARGRYAGEADFDVVGQPEAGVTVLLWEANR